MISDSDLFVTKYVSVPREMGHFNPAAFVAGVVRGVLEGAGFPARCVAGRGIGCAYLWALQSLLPFCLRAAFGARMIGLQSDGTLCACEGPGTAQDGDLDEVSTLLGHHAAGAAHTRMMCRHPIYCDLIVTLIERGK